MYTTKFNGITFVEGRPPGAKLLGPVRIEIDGFLTSAQLKNLDDVKQIMVERARTAGGNAIVDFKYGQRSVGFWRSILDRDDVQWYGEGQIAVLAPKTPSVR